MPSNSGRFWLILSSVLSVLSTNLVRCESDDFQEYCDVYYTNGSEEQFLWPQSSDGAVVVSSPACIDKDDGLILKLCDGEKWLPKEQPKCSARIQNCPRGYFYNDALCIRVTEPREWYNGCSFDEVQISHPTKNSSWISAKRKIKFGHYENTMPDENYGTKYRGYSFNIDTAESDFEKDCLVFTNDLAVPEDCNNKHLHICAHQSKFFYKKCPNGFIDDLRTPNKCYYKKTAPEYCDNDNIAIVTSLDEKISLENLAGGDLCLVNTKSGLEENEKMLTALNGTNWIYKPLENIDCSICTLDIQKQDSPKLVLNFNEKHNELYLSVYFNKASHEKNINVYCFTDASHELKKRVLIEEISGNSQHYKLRLEDYPGRYWCEAFLLSKPNHVTSNKIVAYRKKKGNEFALRLIFEDFCTYFDCKLKDFTEIIGMASNFIESTIFRHQSVKVRPMEVFSYKRKQLDLLMHLSSKRKRHVMAEYNILLGILQNLPQFIHLGYFRSSEFCLREQTESNRLMLNWDITEVGKSAVPREICVQNNGFSVWRVCGGDFMSGASWTTPTGVCSENTRVSETTQSLHNFFIGENFENVTTNLWRLTENTTTLSSLDLYYVTKILDNVNDNLDVNVGDVSKILDNVMGVNPDVLRESQNALNLTDDLLDVVEKHTYKQAEVHLNNYLVKTIESPSINGTGVAVYGNLNSSFAELTVKNVNLGEDFNSDNLILATFIPVDANRTVNNITIILTVFDKDSLFISDGDEKVISKVISVDLVGPSVVFLEDPLPVYFRQFEEDKNTQCAFWDYGKNTQRQKGRWSTVGGKYLGPFSNTSLKMCAFSHLTHFALLISNEKMVVNNYDDVHQSDNDDGDFLLDIITKIGSFLSFLGITGIFLTAVLFEKWRRKTGTKILLQLSSAILLELILTQVTNINLEKDADICVVLGALLQYAVLSKFAWMLVYAFLQYFRFVTVLRPMPEKMILKSAIVGWIFPLVPVLIFSLSNPEDYTPGTRDFCYPKNFSFYLGVLLPILTFVMINMFVFVKIMYEILNRKIEARTQSLQKRQLFLVILLFFVLGVPWIFGILGEFFDGTNISGVFILLFCLTAPLQGFILFIFYVVLNDETRFKWVLVIKNTLSMQD